MRTEHQFADLAESLRKGLLADQILLALARVEKQRKVPDEDRNVFAKAVEILNLIEEGHSWLDTLKLSRQTRLGANYFSQAVEALPQINNSESFVKNLENLKRIAQQLAVESNLPEEADMRELRAFFFKSSQLESDRTDHLLSGEHDSKSHSWLQNDE
jgi:hypothetical protein